MVFSKSLSQKSESNCQRSDGVRVENNPGFTTLGILEEIQKLMTELQCEPEQFKGRIIFMSMYNDIVRRERGNTEKCIMNSVAVANCARRFLRGRSSFLESGSEKKRHGTYSEKPDGKWDKTAERMMLNFAGSGHPFFMPPAPRKEETRRSKGKGRKSFHFNASEETMELVVRTILSLNQLSIYGEVADLCKESSKDSEAAGKLASNEDLESMGIPTELPIAVPHTNAELQGNLLQDFEHKFEQLPEYQKLSNLCSDLGSKIFEKGQFFITLNGEEGQMKWRICREYTLLRSEEVSRVRGWILGNTKIGPVLDVRVCLHQERYGTEMFIESLFRDGTASWVRIVNGINKDVTETSETISLQNVEHRVTGKPVAKAKPRPKPSVTTVSHFFSCSWKKRDRHQSREIPSRLFHIVKSHDSIAATWPISPSKRWWSRTICRYYGRIQGKVRWYFAMVIWRLDILSGKGRRTEEMVSVSLEP